VIQIDARPAGKPYRPGVSQGARRVLKRIGDGSAVMFIADPHRRSVLRHEYLPVQTGGDRRTGTRSRRRSPRFFPTS